MRPAVALIGIFILFFLFLPASARVTEPFPTPGTQVTTCFDAAGDLVIGFVDTEGNLVLEKRTSGDPSLVLDRARVESNRFRRPRLDLDPQGRVWLSGEEVSAGGSRIFLSPLEGLSPAVTIDGSEGFSGWNESPALTFGPDGQPRLVWINRTGGEHLLIFRNIRTGSAHRVNTSTISPVYTPQIVTGPESTWWIFWIQAESGRTVVKGCLTDGSSGVETTVSRNPVPFPSLDPAAALDRHGRPSLVWSAYDGCDYELFSADWDGESWGPSIQITHNRGVMDVNPRMIRLRDGRRFVVWTRIGETSRIYGRVIEGNAGEAEMPLGRKAGSDKHPDLSASGDLLACGWEHIPADGLNPCIQVHCFAASDLLSGTKLEPGIFLRPERISDQSRFKNPLGKAFLAPVDSALDWLKFIGFGDSITYGVIARTWFPDLGYIPRLEILLRSLFESAAVLNRGVPGEMTMEGLARIEAVLVESRAKFLFLMEGTNDMTGRVPSSVAAFNIEEMVKVCRSRDVYPLLASIIPRSDDNWNFVQEETLRLNGYIRDVARVQSLPFVDMFTLFMDHPAGYLSLFSDGAHPDADGYELIASAWFQALLKLPLPPVQLKVERRVNRILLFDETVNVLHWELNPLPDAGIDLAHHIIYRKRSEDGDESYSILARLSPEVREFFDRTLVPSRRYTYLIRMEDDSGIVGPASEAVSDR